MLATRWCATEWRSFNSPKGHVHACIRRDRHEDACRCACGEPLAQFEGRSVQVSAPEPRAAVRHDRAAFFAPLDVARADRAIDLPVLARGSCRTFSDVAACVAAVVIAIAAAASGAMLASSADAARATAPFLLSAAMAYCAFFLWFKGDQ